MDNGLSKSPPSGSGDPSPEPEALLEHAATNPALVARSATRLLEETADPAARTVLQRALGIAARARGDLSEARAALAAAVATAAAADLPPLEGAARMSLAFVLALAGENEMALTEIDTAAKCVEDRDEARLLIQRSFVLQRLGRLDEALAGLTEAAGASARDGDIEGRARALTNRATVYAFRGEFAHAQADLEVARALHERLGQAGDVALVVHNLGFVLGRRGDIPAALRYYDQAQREAERLGLKRPTALIDRCETLLAAHLVRDARQVAERAVRELRAAQMETDVPDALLLLSEAALLDEDPTAAIAAAREAEAELERQGRAGWTALARYAQLRARRVAGENVPWLRARTVAEELSRAGWAVAALDARLVAAELALETGDVTAAHTELRVTAAARRRGPAALRAHAWHAEARLRLAHADRRGAWSALRAGMKAVADNLGALGATELRLHAAGHGERLATTALRLAVETGDASRVLAWSERVRAVSTRAPAVRPPADPALAGLLERLRHVSALVEQASFETRTPGDLLRDHAAAERAVRERSWHLPGRHGAAPPPLSTRELAEGLGERALVEMVDVDGRLQAIVLVGGRATLHDLGPTDPVDAEAEALRFALSRLARPSASAGVRAVYEDAAARLDQALLHPLRARLAGAPLVIVPTGTLHALPWGALPSLRDRPFTAVPSAGLWLACAGDGVALAGPDARVVLVAGPGLAHAEAEVAAVGDAHRGATVLTAEMADVACVMDRVSGATIAHIAAHGTFRADNPLFSSLRMADGPLTLYELEALADPPRVLVLSACDLAGATARPGASVSGAAATLLTLGVSTLVAAVVSVNDAETRAVMTCFHSALVDGADPSAALTHARNETGGGAGFICIGAG